MSEALPIHREERFSPAQEKVIRRLLNEDIEDVELRVSEVSNVRFLRKLSELELDHEIAIYETLGGNARVVTGVINEFGQHSVGEKGLVDSQLERGRIDIHTHPLGDGDVDDERQLEPSTSDMRVYLERAKHTSSPSIIMSSYGAAVVGLNPFEVRKQGSGQERSIAEIKIQRYEDFRDLVIRDIGDTNDARMVMFSLAKEFGFVLDAEPWEDVDSEMLGKCFDQSKATEYWQEVEENNQNEVRANKDELSLINETFTRHQEWWKELFAEWANQSE